jgi:hypothetical protein
LQAATHQESQVWRCIDLLHFRPSVQVVLLLEQMTSQTAELQATIAKHNEYAGCYF